MIQTFSGNLFAVMNSFQKAAGFDLAPLYITSVVDGRGGRHKNTFCTFPIKKEMLMKKCL